MVRAVGKWAPEGGCQNAQCAIMYTPMHMLVSKIRDSFFGEPYNKDDSLLGLYGAPPVLGSYHIFYRQRDTFLISCM